MSLLRRLIKWAGEEDGEDWVRHCLHLPRALGQEAPEKVAPVAVAAATEAVSQTGKEGWHISSRQEEVEADPQQADLERREQGSVISGGVEGQAKRKHFLHRRHSLPHRSAETNAEQLQPHRHQAMGGGASGRAAFRWPSCRRPEEEFPRQPRMPEDADIASRAVAGPFKPLLIEAPPEQGEQRGGHSIPVVCAQPQQQAEVPVNLGAGELISVHLLTNLTSLITKLTQELDSGSQVGEAARGNLNTDNTIASVWVPPTVPLVNCAQSSLSSSEVVCQLM